MNANELADWLYQWCEGKPYPQENIQIVEMLRKQQKEIDSLRKQLKSACNALMETKI